MLESWNDGLKETGIQNAYDFNDFLALMDYFSGKYQQIDALRASSKKIVEFVIHLNTGDKR